MHIVNAFLRLTSLAYYKARGACFSDGTAFDASDSAVTNAAESAGTEGRGPATHNGVGRYQSLPPREQYGYEDDVHAERQSLTRSYETFEHTWAAAWICVYHAAMYYALSVLVYCFIVEEWIIVDALYFATVLFLTIGYGDIYPLSSAGKIAATLLALYGVVILGKHNEVCEDGWGTICFHFHCDHTNGLPVLWSSLPVLV